MPPQNSRIVFNGLYLLIEEGMVKIMLKASVCFCVAVLNKLELMQPVKA